MQEWENGHRHQLKSKVQKVSSAISCTRRNKGIKLTFRIAKEQRQSFGNVARQCFSPKSDEQATISDGLTLLPIVANIPLRAFIPTLLSFSGFKIATRVSMKSHLKSLQSLSTNSCHYAWDDVTPTLHKILVHSVELMLSYNEGRGMKAFSEEGLESSNK